MLLTDLSSERLFIIEEVGTISDFYDAYNIRPIPKEAKEKAIGGL
jgi:hypothetical protein